MSMVLASASPRRREILEMMGVKDLIIRPASLEERVPENASPGAAVRALSSQKARQAAELFSETDVIIGADTVVSVDGAILGKPKNDGEALSMLRRLSGREHEVYTGVTVILGKTEICEHETTIVRFRPITEREARAYIATGECGDKAGAYGIQGPGGLFISGIRGDYYNVVGLPLCRLGLILGRLGVDLI